MSEPEGEGASRAESEVPLKNIKDIGTADIDRPYERCLLLGEQSLSDAQLLAAVIRTGRAGKDAVSLAAEVLERAGGLPGLTKLSVRELTAIPGIGQVKAVLIRCIGEMSKRIAVSKARPVLSFRDPETVAEYYMEQLRFAERETLLCMMLDSKGHLLGDAEISRGTADHTPVSVRDIFLRVLEYRANAIILVHNHPSGDPAPSGYDRDVTARVARAGQMMQVQLLDHIIIGDREYYSFRDDSAPELDGISKI